MKRVFLTGSTGFVGKNLITNFDSKYDISKYTKNSPISINHDIVIHLAGKAHDLKKVANVGEYYKVNTELTIKMFEAFLTSEANVFITISSVKAVSNEFAFFQYLFTGTGRDGDRVFKVLGSRAQSFLN